MIKSWIFEFVEPFHQRGVAPSPQHVAENYAWHLAMWQRAETLGFDGIFFSEHHFVEGRLSPSPHLFIAALATATKRLRLGVMGTVLPLHHPWRVAEEFGMLDQMTGGRLEIGLSSGVHPNETAAIGIANEEVRARFYEGMEVLERAMSQKSFTYHGRFFDYEDLTIFPKPLQQPLPPRWITGVSPETAEGAAQRGFKVCTGFATCDKIKIMFDAYKAAADKAGFEATGDELGLRRQIFIADSEAEIADIAAHARATMAADPNAGPYKSKRAETPAPAHADEKPAAEAAKAGGHVSGAVDAPVSRGSLFTGQDETIAGTPAQVAERIIDQCRRTGAGHILGYPFQAVTRAQMTRNYELWGEVIPILKKAEVAG